MTRDWEKAAFVVGRAFWCVALICLVPAWPLSAEGIRREVFFEATFLNEDLEWHGDPASPLCIATIKPDARPIETDFGVRSIKASTDSFGRMYYREARLGKVDGKPTILAFTSQKEKIIGTIDEAGRFVANDFFRERRDLLSAWPADPKVLRFDADEKALYAEVDVARPFKKIRVGRISSIKFPPVLENESLDFLPLELPGGGGTYVIEFVSPTKEGEAPLRLAMEGDGKKLVLATATIPILLVRESAILGSFDNKQGTYLAESVYRDRKTSDTQDKPSVTFTIPGIFTSAMKTDGNELALAEPPATSEVAGQRPTIKIDGRFDDWRNIPGIDDPRGDVVSYLEYLPDVDILEFKVAHDDANIYLYARVAGQVGRTSPDGGRSYFYAYMDVDQNPQTGFIPSRDDECYFGVDIGDDCEVQFEFVNNTLRKTFYGFCGKGGNENVLRQQVTIGQSQYGRLDDQGRERADYKAEYIFRDGKTEITEDLKLGTSDTIRLAVSPDGHEVEIVSTFAGFLKDSSGKPTVQVGQTIDIAAGMEGDCKLYPGKTRWGADNTQPIWGYRLTRSVGESNNE